MFYKYSFIKSNQLAVTFNIKPWTAIKFAQFGFNF